MPATLSLPVSISTPSPSVAHSGMPRSSRVVLSSPAFIVALRSPVIASRLTSGPSLSTTLSTRSSMAMIGTSR